MRYYTNRHFGRSLDGCPIHPPKRLNYHLVSTSVMLIGSRDSRGHKSTFFSIERRMQNRLIHAMAQRITLVFLIASSMGLTRAAEPESSRPLRALLIAGGCCHDYANQQRLIREGIQARANVRVDVYWTDNSTTAPVFPLYSKLNWAEEYDVIIHDECGASIKDPAIVNRIVQVHKKLPAVHLHCAMHSFRTGGDEWFQHLGLQSTGHGPQQPIEIIFEKPNHPITESLSTWTTGNEELYNNVKRFGAIPLAIGKQIIPGPNPRTVEAVVAWTNETQGARSFSTTLGHNTSTVGDKRYLDLITRGLLWSCSQLNDQYLIPYAGEQTTTFIDKNKFNSPKDSDLGTAPKDATLVKLIASSTQNGHPTYHAIDGKDSTRWCASNGNYPQSITMEFEKPQPVERLEIKWEFEDRQYQARIEGRSKDNEWTTLYEGSFKGTQTVKLSSPSPIQSLKVTGLQSTGGGWCSIKELRPIGDGIGPLWPADLAKKDQFVPLAVNQYVSSGNTIPKIAALSEAEEAEILKEVKVPEGFKATIFAAPPAVNYPVFVASSVDGTLYVSSDGNGSLGRDPMRGRIIRLRDLNGDGRADETKVFCEVDAPRGLLWDRDRLFVMHPPNLSVFFDHDGDGVADEQKTLVKNLAFDYKDRPADHTTNGLSIGVDGWLYLAGGDFGFINATGSDGTTLTHRGGGVIRVRPDGTQLELYSTGTRNILEVAISPEMEMFARDNTNDGGGWDVRLHHFTGNEDHGYPRLYKNFNNECVQPLADYGGGSGCGAVYVAEPGFGTWGNAPFTADWGTGGLYRHDVKRNGSTFSETTPPQPFIQLPRPTDADIDGNSRLFCASWKGATFKWNGPDVGYIVCVQPEDFTPPPMPAFKDLTDKQLVSQFESPSHRRRLAAQRELFYRGSDQHQILHHSATGGRPAERNLLDQLQTTASIDQCIDALEHDDKLIQHTAIRVLARRGAANDCFVALDKKSVQPELLLRSLAMMHRPDVVDGLIARLPKSTENIRSGILNALARLHFLEGDWKGNSWGTRPDTRGPYYQPETWKESAKIRATLEAALRESSTREANELVRIMRLNRIESNSATEKMIELALSDESLLTNTLEQLVRMPVLPKSTNQLLQKVTNNDRLGAQAYLNTLQLVFRKDNQVDHTQALTILSFLSNERNNASTGKRIAEILQRSELTDLFFASINGQSDATKMTEKEALSRWVMAIVIASRSNSSPEQKSVAQEMLESGIRKTASQARIIEAAVWLDNHHLDSEIWKLQASETESISKLAKQAISKLKIEQPMEDKTPLIKSLALEQAIQMVAEAPGDAALGKAIYEKAKCATCHTVTQTEAQKGPYLGTIAKTYKRPELAVAILQPEKTIAQGFATNSFLTVDGIVLTGFVTDEQNDRVILRDQEGKEHQLMKEEIEVRKKLPTSMMPNGILNEFTVQEASSLIEYLTEIASQ